MRRRFMSNKKTKSVKYCTITATQDNTSISSSDFLNLYYAINNTDYWSRGSTLIFATLNAGDSIYLKCIGFGVVNTCININCDKDVILSGNILSLVFGDNNSNETSLSHIKSGIGIASFSNVIKVSSDFLPSKELGAGCYTYMFANCPRLTQAPELPATTLADYCYNGMFKGCVSLKKAPVLPALNANLGCYDRMFKGCTNLNYIKMLATDISASGCLDYWVKGVSSTGTFVKNPDATWDTTPGALGDSGVPAGWAVVNDGEEEGGKIINTGRIKPAEIQTAYINWDFPVASNVSVIFHTEMSAYEIPTNTGKNKSRGLTLGPGESELIVDYIEPIEDDTYIYEVIVEE